MNRICYCSRRITHTLVRSVQNKPLVVREELLFGIVQKIPEERRVWRDPPPVPPPPPDHYQFDSIESPGGGSVEYTHQ